ncbi:MAG: ribosome-associated translation inhibitor RaiA [Acidobacteria bacterium]|jgi:putative sigma-54 modulation protein|nr:ribosome-associated translation inhibitor RaiA [Acidobacteriota bacterium]
MQIEYTGRHVHITQAYRKLCEEGLGRVHKILGRVLSAHVVLSSEKYRYTAEITIKIRGARLVSVGESTSMDTALRMALDKAETQAKRQTKKTVANKRLPKVEKTTLEPVLTRVRRGAAIRSTADRSAAEADAPTPAQAAARNGKNGTSARAAAKPVVPVTVHSFPAKKPVIEPHVVRSLDSVALRPMTLEEAVKEAEFRDRDVFVFRRNSDGALCVLHRKRDGKMELIEAP